MPPDTQPTPPREGPPPAPLSSPFAVLVFLVSGAILISFILGSLIVRFAPEQKNFLQRAGQAILSEEEVERTVGTVRLRVPAHYLRPTAKTAKTAKTAQGQDASDKRVTLHALLPDLAPYGKDNWEDFEDNSAGGRVVAIWMTERGQTFDASRRMETIYRPRLTRRPEGDAYNLSLYRFNAGTERAGEELYTGRDDKGRLALFLCYRKSTLVPSPGCTRSFLLNDTTALTYRFKRTHLNNWQDIDKKIQAFIAGLRVPDEAVNQGL